MHVIIEQFKQFYCFSKFSSSDGNSWKARSCCWQKYSFCYCESVNFLIQLCCIFYLTLIIIWVYPLWRQCDGCYGWLMTRLPWLHHSLNGTRQFVTERFLTCWLASLLIVFKMDSIQSSSNTCKNYSLKIYSQHGNFVNAI